MQRNPENPGAVPASLPCHLQSDNAHSHLPSLVCIDLARNSHICPILLVIVVPHSASAPTATLLPPWGQSFPWWLSMNMSVFVKIVSAMRSRWRVVSLNPHFPPLVSVIAAIIGDTASRAHMDVVNFWRRRWLNEDWNRLRRRQDLSYRCRNSDRRRASWENN